jgi:hypothetical protein
MEHLAACNFFLFGYMKEQLKRMSSAEEEEFLSVLYEFMNEIPPDVVLQVFSNWNRRLRLCLLMEGGCVEQHFNLLWFSTGLDKRARRVRVLNAHSV